MPPTSPVAHRVSGAVLIDLSDVEPDRIRRRVAAAAYAPDGCRVVLIVGAIACDPEGVRILRDHGHRLEYEVLGEPHAVGRWVSALRDGLDLW